MAWQPKPRNWREYSGWYRPPSKSPPAAIADTHAYVKWLAKARGWSIKEAQDYCEAMDKRKIISAVHNNGALANVPAEAPILKPAKRAPRPGKALLPQNIVAFPAPVREAAAPFVVHDRKTAAAELLREIAGNYGPRRAHKLRAMADWLEGKPAVGKTATGG